jgi:hypothetical protein
MLRPSRVSFLVAALAVAVPSAVTAPAALAQKRPPAADDDDDDDGPGSLPQRGGLPRAAEPPKDDKKDAKDDKKADKKDAKDAKKDAKDAKKDAKADKKADKKDAKAPAGDVLEETAADKAKRQAEDDARKKAEDAAAAAAAKKAEEQEKLTAEKRAAEDKRRAEGRDSRLASAKRVRPYQREQGEIVASIQLQPGAVVAGQVVEVRLDVGRRLKVADPRYGSREPQRGLNLVARVSDSSGKKPVVSEYMVHPLGAPGIYGFHMTPQKDGVLDVQIVGEVAGRTVNFALPLHVGVWPPPDFDDEDKKILGDRKGS